MIKVLFFIEKFTYNGAIGGAEKALISLVNHMDPNQFDITVQTVFPDKYASLLNNNIRYRYCYPRKNTISLVLYRVEAELGLIYRFHIKDEYDIEVAFLEFVTTKIIAASTNRKSQKVAWVHCDLNIAVRDKKAFVAKTEKYYKKYDKIVCVSDQCKKSFDEIFGMDYDTVVLHNVIDENEILAKAEAGLPEGVTKRRYTICSVGNFTPPKNHIRLLNTCRKLVKAGFTFDLWLVGDGALREKIEKCIQENEMQSYVFLMGFQANPYPFMKHADLLVCSSDYEGYSTFIVEGVILGKRIITTACSGMHEILDGYKNGTIVENDDASFYEGMGSALTTSEDEELCNDVRLFTPKSEAVNNEAFFRDLVILNQHH